MSLISHASPSFNLAASKKHFLRKQEQYRRTIENRYKQAIHAADQIIHYIIDRFEVDKIYQWGSLIYPRNFNELSDIDIALLGLREPTQIFKILSFAESVTFIPLDIVLLEKIHAAHRALIINQGKLIYERS